MRTLLSVTIIGAIALFFNSCVSYQSGPQGIPGANGTNGVNGGANIATEVVKVGPGEWIWNAADSVWQTLPYPDDSLYAKVLSNGMIEVYLSVNDTVWTGLPATIYSTKLGVTSTYQFVYNETLPDQISFALGYSNGLQNMNPDSLERRDTIFYKVVSIPPAVIKQHPNTDWKNWGQVSALITGAATKAKSQ